MSRLNSLSAAAIKAMFSSETDDQLIMLVTITDPTTVSATQTISSTNEIVLSSAANYNIDDSILFSLSAGNLVANTTYYIIAIDYTSNRIQVSTSPRGTTLALSNSTTTNTVSRLIRICDSYTTRLGFTTDTDIVYGVISSDRQFIFVPIEISLPGETETGDSNCRIVINYVTPELIEMIRTNLTKPADVQLELVLSKTPDYVEAVFTGYAITSVAYNANQITFELNMISLSREPFPAYNFTPKYFPGLF
jgi:hypothetical protein